jgi:hypothetical protein
MEDARLIGASRASGVITSRRLLAIACVFEAATGLALLLFPPTVTDLLFGAAVVGVGVVLSRIGGFSLIALGVACWPGDRRFRALAGMLAYGAPVTLYLLYLGLAGAWSGALLWPAMVVHLLLTMLLARAWLHERHKPA